MFYHLNLKTPWNTYQRFWLYAAKLKLMWLKLGSLCQSTKELIPLLA
jgi:hypothetical protein